MTLEYNQTILYLLEDFIEVQKDFLLPYALLNITTFSSIYHRQNQGLTRSSFFMHSHTYKQAGKPLHFPHRVFK